MVRQINVVSKIHDSRSKVRKSKFDNENIKDLQIVDSYTINNDL